MEDNDLKPDVVVDVKATIRRMETHLALLNADFEKLTKAGCSMISSVHYTEDGLIPVVSARAYE